MMVGPLNGVKILEFACIGPGPYCGQLLADMGAEVTVVDRPTRGDIALEHTVDRRGKKSIVIDLKSPKGVAIALDLMATSDGIIEGSRPGVMERLGLGPKQAFAKNPTLIYGRMTGWGQTGPYAGMAGHDINFLSLTGALQAMGPADRPPFPPLNLVGDYGGGSLFLAMGMLAAMLQAKTTGKGQVVDASITDGVNSMMGFLHGMAAAGKWTETRGANWVDGGSPFYQCYETRDGKYMAVGSIEPKFFAMLLNGVDIISDEYGPQTDETQFPRQQELLTARFRTKTQAEWTAVFDDTDACVTPVLSYVEAINHPQMQARGALQVVDGLTHPAIAPVIGQGAKVNTVIGKDGDETRMILKDMGLSEIQIDTLVSTGVIQQS